MIVQQQPAEYARRVMAADIPRKRVRLVMAQEPEDLWRSVIAPWIRRRAPDAWRAASPPAIIVPTRAYAAYLRGRMLEEELDQAGLHIYTPEDCRTSLALALNPQAAPVPRPDLEIVIAALAAQRADENETAAAVARDPTAAATLLEELSGAGWNAHDGVPVLQQLIDEAQSLLASRGLVTERALDRLLFQRAADGAALYGDVLVTGFDAAGWNRWNLLNAIVSAAQEATVCLFNPAYRSEQLDRLWIGSWEQFYGPAEETGGPNEEGPLAALAAEIGYAIQAAPAGTAPPVRFLAGSTARAQAEAVVTEVIWRLAHSADMRIAILVPGYGALSREIGTLLRSNSITHNDLTGYNVLPPAEEEAWNAWLDFQQEERLDTLLEFLAVERRRNNNPIPQHTLEKLLAEALTELQVDDPRALLKWCREYARAPSHVVEALEKLERLPASAALHEYLAHTRTLLDKAGLPLHARRLDSAAGTLALIHSQEISREIFLRWLRQTLRFDAWRRPPDAVHPYARVHLLSYTQADRQAWDYIIMTGLNQDHWPPPDAPSPFLSEDLIARLNRAATTEGAQGEGHQTVKPGKTPILGPAEKRALFQRQFCSLLEASRHGACATCALTDESEPGRRLLPADILCQLYHKVTDRPLSDDELDDLEKATRAWCRAQPLSHDGKPGADDDPQIVHTARAYHARRRTDVPFGEYEFCLSASPDRPIVLPCKEWERALRCPATVWLEHVIGVHPPALDTRRDGWDLTLGTWVHRWLSKAVSPRYSGRLVAFEAGKNVFLRRLRAAAAETRRAADACYAAAGLRPTDTWEALWNTALHQALRIVAALDTIHDRATAAAEWSLPPLAVKTASGRALHIAGRIDLLLGSKHSDGRLEDNAWWVIDYKTGSSDRRPLTPASLPAALRRGEAVQICLYGLALRAAGARETCLSVIRPGFPPEIQVTAEDAASVEDFWDELGRMQDDGVFGMRTELRPPYGPACTLPLATLPVSAEILNLKWKATHPAFDRGKSDE